LVLRKTPKDPGMGYDTQLAEKLDPKRQIWKAPVPVHQRTRQQRLSDLFFTFLYLDTHYREYVINAHFN